jgi:hypothetical protein
MMSARGRLGVAPAASRPEALSSSAKRPRGVADSASAEGREDAIMWFVALGRSAFLLNSE